MDDNRDLAQAISIVLTKLGHEVRVAYDGPSALTLAEEFTPDVALLDIGLPGLDGYEVARRLRAASARDVRLIAITGYGQATDRQRSSDAGFDSHLVKPVDAAILQRAIEEARARFR